MCVCVGVSVVCIFLYLYIVFIVSVVHIPRTQQKPTKYEVPGGRLYIETDIQCGRKHIFDVHMKWAVLCHVNPFSCCSTMFTHFSNLWPWKSNEVIIFQLKIYKRQRHTLAFTFTANRIDCILVEFINWEQFDYIRNAVLFVCMFTFCLLFGNCSERRRIESVIVFMGYDLLFFFIC